MKNLLLPFVVFSMIFISCEGDDSNVLPINQVVAPATYTFERNGQTTVNYSGQTTRIQMAEEMIDAFFEPTKSEEAIVAMYTNEEGQANFSNEALNTSGKNIKSKVAASKDLFETNAVVAAEIKNDFETFIAGQVNEVFPAWNNLAEPGVAGQIAEGTTPRYVNAKGLEFDQAFVKGILGALMTDQMIHNYLSPTVLDEASNRADNDAEITVEGKPYTTMEHKWDEAYGYLFGNASDGTNPMLTLGEDDSFLNKYLARQEGDPDFEGASQRVFEAFKLGRAAIVAGEYNLRDEQAEIIKKEISDIIGVRAVYYLQIAKVGFANGDLGAALHDLSEGYGFIYALQFTRNAETDGANFTKAEVDSYLNTLLESSENGLWDISFDTLDELSNTIAARFDFTVEEALN